MSRIDNIAGTAAAKIKETIAKCLSGLPGKPGGVLSSIREKKRLLLLSIGGFALFLIVLFANTGLPKTEITPAEITQKEDSFSGFTLGHEELFYPSEPDFAPEFLVGREPKNFWSVDDIGAYWRNPENTELWKDQIKKAVDALMEGVL